MRTLLKCEGPGSSDPTPGRILSLAVAAILLLAAAGSAQTPPETVALWPLDEGAGAWAADVVDGNDAEIFGATWDAGPGRPALLFDGVNDFARAGCGGDPRSAELKSYTIEACVRWAGQAKNWRGILGKPVGNCSDPYGLYDGIGLGVNANGSLFGWSAQDAYWPWARTVPVLEPDEWTHVAVTCRYLGYRAREFRFYVDGQEVAIEHGDVGLTIFSTPYFYLGAGSPGGQGGSFGGSLAGAAVHDRPLSPAEIRANYESGLIGSCFEIHDADGDGVPDDLDVCSETAVPEATVPSVRLRVNRWALIDDDDVFDTRRPNGRGPARGFTLADTGGCSCEQIIDALGLGRGHRRFGCSLSAMEAWVDLVNP